MANETDRMILPSSTNEFLIRFDERQSIMSESLRDIKDEMISIKAEVRSSQVQTRDELIKRMDEVLMPIDKRVCALEADMRTMHEMRYGLSGGEKLLGTLLVVLNIYIAYKNLGA